MAMDDSECKSWTSLADLLCSDPSAPVAWLGLPLGEKSLTPGRCDRAPGVLRNTLPRLSVYDLETETDLSHLRVFDSGDLPLKAMSPAEAFAPLRDAAAGLMARHDLTLLIGGNNAITRPGLHALGLERAGLLTLDAHFDLRDTDCGITNGNPVQCLLDDGLPGARIAQIGLQPFANTRRMHDKATAAGIAVYSMADIRRSGIEAVVRAALQRLSERCEAIYVDFDIDVIARAEAPGAPGARPWGMPAGDFFAAARMIAAHPKVRAVDLTEFDPALDVSDITALTAGRWVAEILAGVSSRMRGDPV